MRKLKINDNIQHKLKRVRPPRVKISYDVEIGDAVESRELPFVGAIVSDLAGDNSEGQVSLRERTFVEVDNENVDDALSGINPKLSFTVTDKLSDSGGNLNVALDFNSMADFQPESVIQQVEPLRRLYEARQRLNDLAAKLDGNDELDSLLLKVIQDTTTREALENELKSQSDQPDKPEPKSTDE
jgi:type VI secretion system protein ImpB